MPVRLDFMKFSSRVSYCCRLTYNNLQLVCAAYYVYRVLSDRYGMDLHMYSVRIHIHYHHGNLNSIIEKLPEHYFGFDSAGGAN